MSSYPSRRSTRLRGYDYAQAGAYFVTLCIEHRLPLLGSMYEDAMVLSLAGEMVATVWGNLGTHYAGVSVDAFVVMPNHLHGIIVLSGQAEADRDGEDRDRAQSLHRSLRGDRLIGRTETGRTETELSPYTGPYTGIG